MLVYAEFGRLLVDCESVYQFLRVMYDALSAQMNACGDRMVLHRNISDRTVMIANMTGGELPSERANYEPKEMHARYIKEILGEFEPGEDASRLAECLIVDFDDCVLQVPGMHEADLVARTGTPNFMARSVARMELLPADRATTYPSIPHLPKTGPFFAKYRELNQHFEAFETFSRRTFSQHVQHKSKTGALVPERPSFAHLLVHDAESTLWVITSWLIHALPAAQLDPKAEKEHVSSEAYRRICTTMYLDPPESRDLTPSALEWHKLLHPDLPSSLATMLAEMHQYLRPEWGIFPERNLLPTHAHEALRRLLFKEIVGMKESGDEVQLAEKRYMPVHSDVQKEIDERNVMKRLSRNHSPFDTTYFLATEVKDSEGKGAMVERGFV
ncbi:hypothetical protein BDV93DRAFT_559753 [Ceratobasidium sp. AG-I]|nr:hypothetical protein BDV93DRAFT_559753 [Ceratobasidium sp. AG-I]